MYKGLRKADAMLYFPSRPFRKGKGNQYREMLSLSRPSKEKDTDTEKDRPSQYIPNKE
jgi:hypothetical protein